MPELGYVVYLLALAFGLGQLWYSVLDFRHDHWMRMASYPFLGIVLGEAFVPMGPEVFGVHIMVAFVATLIACILDRVIHTIRPAHEEAALRPSHA